MNQDSYEENHVQNEERESKIERFAEKLIEAMKINAFEYGSNGNCINN